MKWHPALHVVVNHYDHPLKEGELSLHKNTEDCYYHHLHGKLLRNSGIAMHLYRGHLQSLKAMMQEEYETQKLDKRPCNKRVRREVKKWLKRSLKEFPTSSEAESNEDEDESDDSE
jgi:hypothetical protein